MSVLSLKVIVPWWAVTEMFVFILLCGEQAQGLTHARHTFFHWATYTSSLQPVSSRSLHVKLLAKKIDGWYLWLKKNDTILLENSNLLPVLSGLLPYWILFFWFFSRKLLGTHSKKCCDHSSCLFQWLTETGKVN